MDQIRIIGGSPLSGTVTIQGSKNAALPMMAASLLQEGVCVLKGCPRIADVFCMEEILKTLGAVTYWEDNNLYLDCSHIRNFAVTTEYTKRMRSSIMLLGAVTGRMEKGCIGYPGGCVIGKRPIDMHLEVLKRLGAEILEEGGVLCADTGKKGFRGAEIVFEKSSVGATEQGILAGVCALGDTWLYHCAKEPEIYWLGEFLNQMGASVSGAGTDVIHIQGRKKLKGISFRIPPDRIVAGTYICAGAATRGKVILKNPPLQELEAFLKVYQKMGGQYKVNSGKLTTDSSRVGLPVPYLETDVFPGFPTDLQSQVLAVLTTAEGMSHIRETIFEDRFKAARELRKMGADIEVQGQDAWVRGRPYLTGTQVRAEELRGGAALVLAGLGAVGETIISGCSYITRGYEHICEDLAGLGGKIEGNTRKIYEGNI
ncbi:UDP-N-acetylglucosamine 1-carboxyvinyltransferase [Blautia sp. An249]|uniref:UDP-N-acetylglucosamine 1-carboxyvinyltransferase n=1 Tax=Blautia sp. An249 TaxID=1965603 RepID=UPI000B389F09|nr:UDP-N-acetylglucosamine 1-carboxyvinyltransferase [Blautia sp. An249]OUO80667.1 UDP-N-acetylglucosamine 1-carboxyvinyltransferase [Blautia sp. An249]